MPCCVGYGVKRGLLLAAVVVAGLTVELYLSGMAYAILANLRPCWGRDGETSEPDPIAG